MISQAANDLAHRQIILDLTIRTLERESKHLDALKMQQAFGLWIDSKIKELHTDLKNVKSELGKIGAKVHPGKSDNGFTIYTVTEQRREFDLKYHNIALKNWTEEEVKRLLGLEYRK